MGLYERERQLSILCGISLCLSITTIAGITVPWVHWKDILNTCMSYSCECILYGTDYLQVFTGGKPSLCYFTTFASVPVLIIALFLAGYHGYRVCMNGRKLARKPRRVGNVTVIESPYDGPGLKWWIIFLVLACSVCVLLFATAVTLTDGYYSTCKEYRHRMARYEINGQMASAVANRLKCDAVLDFMDYVEPFRRPFFRKDYVNYNYPHEEKDYERGSPVNTGVSLQIAITSAWINSVAWGAIIINYAVLIRSTGKCC